MKHILWRRLEFLREVEESIATVGQKVMSGDTVPESTNGPSRHIFYLRVELEGNLIVAMDLTCIQFT